MRNILQLIRETLKIYEEILQSFFFFQENVHKSLVPILVLVQKVIKSGKMSCCTRKSNIILQYKTQKLYLVLKKSWI